MTIAGNMKLLDLLSTPIPRLLVSTVDTSSVSSIDGSPGPPLRLLDASEPVNMRDITRRLGRKSAVAGGRAYVIHPDRATRAQFDTVLRRLGLTAVNFDDEKYISVEIAQDQPQIILWGMPGCTSRDLARIDAVAQSRMLPIVIVASLGDEVTLDEVQNAGACDLIILPLPCHRLAPALSMALL